MATAVMNAPLLAPRPPPWAYSAHLMMGDGKENRPTTHKLLPPATNGLPAPRPRRERPCDGCRRRKSKCVLQESRKCVLCEFHKQDCTFVENALPRKRKRDDTSPEGSRKSSIAGPSSASSVTTAPAPTLTSTTSLSSGRTPAPRPSPHQHLPPPPSARSPARLSTASSPPAVIVPSSPPRPAATTFASDESLSLQAHRHCKYLGPTTALDAAVIGLSSFDSNHETASSVGTLRQVTRSEYFSTHADADIPLPADEARALAEIEAVVDGNGPALIDIYFRHVHPSYPIIQKQTFLDRLHHGNGQFNPPLLAAMYLLALSWWDSDPELVGKPRPDVARLEYIAMSSLGVAMQRPKISAVQAGLLLLQRGTASTWIMTVQLVSLAQEIGLHLDCTEWSIPLWERRLRKRLAWGLYIQDKWAALVHGRPSHINAVDWAVQPLTDDDFDESSTPYAIDDHEDEQDSSLAIGRMHFMQLISLTAIMAEVCGTFYSQTAVADFQRAGRNATQLVLQRAKPVQIRLKDWFAKLPADCKIETGIASIPTSPSNITKPTNCTVATGALHLAYFATEITIHRRIVQTLVPGDQASTLTTQPPVDPYLLYICRSAAKTRLISAMDFVNRLSPTHLQAFWYFAAPANLALIGVFGALLQASSPAAEESAFYAARLREFRWTLAVSAPRAPRAAWIRSAIDLVDASAEMLRGLGQKPSAETLGEGWKGSMAAASAARGRVKGVGVGAGRDGCVQGEENEFQNEGSEGSEGEMMDEEMEGSEGDDGEEE